MWDFFLLSSLEKEPQKNQNRMLLSKEKEMNTCNFQVIRIAQRPIPAPPSQTKIGLLTSNVSFCLVNIATPSAGMRRDRGSPHQVQFQLGSGSASLEGFTPSFSSFVPQGLQNVIISSGGAGKSANLPRPAFPHL